MRKRLFSLLLIFLMLFTSFPQVTGVAYADSEYPGSAFVSLSYDGKFVVSDGENDGVAIAHLEVPLQDIAEIDLSAWGLEEYSYTDYDTGEPDPDAPTVLKLYLYLLEHYYGSAGDGIPLQTSGAVHSFFMNHFWGHDCNLLYYVNGTYPLFESGWGATADGVILNDGDFVDVALYTDWDFYGNPLAGFNYFAEADSDPEDCAITFEYEATQGEPLTVQVIRGMGDVSVGQDTAFSLADDLNVHYGSEIDVDDDSDLFLEEGQAQITFDEPGEYYVWVDGGFGENTSSPVSCAAVAKVTVAPSAIPQNNIPTLADGVSATADASVEIDKAYELNLADIFTDADGDELTYTVAINSAAAVTTDASYSYTPDAAGTYTLVFIANDGKADSEDTYTVTLTAIAPAGTDPTDIYTHGVDSTSTWYVRGSNGTYGYINKLIISGVTVNSFEWDGNTCNVVLESDTDSDATMTFTANLTGAAMASLYNNEYVKFNLTASKGQNPAAQVNLVDGVATVTVKPYYNRETNTNVGTEKTISITTAEGTPKELTGIAITTPPTKTSYYSSEAFDPTDMVVVASYDDGSTKAVSHSKLTFTPERIGADTTEITVSYEGFAATQPITVTALPNYVAVVNYTKAPGSIDLVEIQDENGIGFAGVTSIAASGTTINVSLDHSTNPVAKLKAVFTLTQVGEFPFLSNSSAFNQGTGSRTNTFTTTLSAGTGTATAYLYDHKPGATTNTYDTIRVVYSIENTLPVLADGQPSSVNEEITAGDNFTHDLTELFTDEDGDALTYKVAVDGASAIAADSAFSWTTNTPGEHTLVFTANDGFGDSTVTFTVNLNVANSSQVTTMTVNVPEGISPTFFATNGFNSNGIDVLGDELQAMANTAVDGMIPYTLTYPSNLENVSIRAEGLGGMAFVTQEDGVVSIRQVHVSANNLLDEVLDATFNVKYDGHVAAAGTNANYLLTTGQTFTYTASPSNTTKYVVGTKSEDLLEDSSIAEVMILVPYNNAKTIIAPTGAQAKLYNYERYYYFTEYPAEAVVDNGDGTSTTYFIVTKGSYLVYRTTMEGKITKAALWGGTNVNSRTVTWTDNDPDPDTVVDQTSNTAENARLANDSVLLNVNEQNHLYLNEGESFTLKAYRDWEIIPVDYNNWIVTPDFHFDVLSGNDIITLNDKQSPSQGDGDWKTITGTQAGVSVVEVKYDAVLFSNATNGYNGLYGATDPARTGLVVVQVGGTKANVDFGIKAKISQSSSNTRTYNESGQRAWDAEFDTAYFVGEAGTLQLEPKSSEDITEVAVSNDKGGTWSVLDSDEGTYIAPIVEGNNIIRVTTSNGVAYQVVRGKSVTYTVTNETNPGEDPSAGDTITVKFNRLYSPIPKMAGNYNPGYQSNRNATVNYYVGDNQYAGPNTIQYGCPSTFQFTVPDTFDGTEELKLTDGYIFVGVIGLTGFTSGGDSHRNIPDNGCTTRGSADSWHTRSILPEIILYEPSDNTPPHLNFGVDGSVEASIHIDDEYTLDLSTIFTDDDGDSLAYKVKIGTEDLVEADSNYSFTPSEPGEITLVFTANDGNEESIDSYTVTLTATDHEWGDPEWTWTGNDEEGYTAAEVKFTCTKNSAHTETVTATVTSDKEGTYKVYTATAEHNGAKFTDTQTVLIEEKTAKVNFTSQLNGGFLHAPQFNTEVSSHLAESYGFNDGIEDVSALDVLVAAHKLVYDDAFSAENVEDYLVVSNNNVSKQFGVDNMDYFGGFFVNRCMQNDGTESLYGGWNGTLVGTAPITDGDLVEFFFYEDDYYGDTYNWFTDSDGNYSREFNNCAGEEIELTLKGVFAMQAYNFKDSDEMIEQDSAYEIEDAQIYVVNLETGALTEIEDAITDEDGIVTLSFDEPGTYTITAYGNDDCIFTQIMSLTTITVTAHKWGEPTYDWSDDNSKVTATRVCENKKEHEETETADTTYEVTKDATCTAKGETTYTATFENNAFTEQSKTLEDVPALGHTPGKAVEENEVAATCEKDGSYDEVVYCEVCKTEISRETKTTDKLGHNYGSWKKLDDNQHQRVCTHDNSHVQTENHKWDEGQVKKPATETKEGVKLFTCTVCKATKTESIPKLDHKHTMVKTAAKKATCTAEGNIEYYTCSGCKKIFKDAAGKNEIKSEDTIVKATGHSYGAWKVTKKATCTTAGIEECVCANDSSHKKTREIKATGHKWDGGKVTTAPTNFTEGVRTYTCLNDSKHTKTEKIPKTNAILERVYENDRYGTACDIGTVLKKEKGIEKYKAVVIASGDNFPDALSGAYLAKVKNAPIVLVNKASETRTVTFIKNHLVQGGQVYILGGDAAVPQTIEGKLKGFKVKRLGGNNRFDTNINILKEAGVRAEDILVCSGLDYADALSASATGKPVFLVGNALTDNQKTYLKSLNTKKYYIIGGTGAVAAYTAKDIAAYGDKNPVRVSGSTRYETSVEVAKRFFKNPKTIVLAYAQNFPDGLSGGPLALQVGGPIILADSNASNNKGTKAYAKSVVVKRCIVLGGPTLISDQAAKDIMSTSVAVKRIK